MCDYTTNSAITDKPRDAFRRQSRSPNMIPFHMLCMVSYYCAIVTLSARRNVIWDILQKCRDLENRVKGPWRSLKMSPFDRDPMTSYWCSIWLYLLSFLRYSMSKNITTLKSRSRVNQGQWYNSTDWVWFSIILSLKRTVFLDIRLQKCRDLESRVRGPSRSLKMSPFDRARMTSY